jgi:hypothetical protein
MCGSNVECGIADLKNSLAQDCRGAHPVPKGVPEMDENSGIKKKQSAVSARSVVRDPSGRGPAAPASAGPPNHIQIQAAAPNMAETMQVIGDGSAQTGPNVKAYIERQLKSVYDDVLNQPIPDRFLELLNTLDKGVDGNKPKTEDK